MIVLVSSAKRKKATISFTTSSSTTSSKCTGILKSISMLHQWTNFLGISQTSQSCIDLDKIFLWNSFHQQLVSFFSFWVFFQKNLWFAGQQGKGEAVSLTLLYRFQLHHRHLDISQATNTKSSPLHIASSQTQNRNLCFLTASC